MGKSSTVQISLAYFQMLAPDASKIPIKVIKGG